MRAIFFAAACLAACAASAHRLSPAYFGMTETEPGLFATEWKVSISGGLVDALEPKVPEPCAVEGDVRRFVVDDARLMHARLRCAGLAGASFTSPTQVREAIDAFTDVHNGNAAPFEWTKSVVYQKTPKRHITNLRN